MPKKINSRAKGAVGEREFAAFLREHGYEARRGQQFSGGGDSPDVVGLPGAHLELKRTERFQPYDAFAQACRDSSGTDNMPIVAHRYNRGEWMVFLRARDLIELWKLAEVMR